MRRAACIPFLAAVLAAAIPFAATAAEPVRIGMVTTLSTGGGYLGEDIRNGFQLALDQGDGALGGVPVELIVEDDGREPGNARQLARRLIESEGVRLMTGSVFSNVAMATIPSIVRDGVIYISPNAGPAQLAGRLCHENYFNAAYQNDNFYEAMGQYFNDEGLDNVYLLAPNYAAGKDALTGFKRYFDGNVVGEVYTQLGQTDYAAEIADLRAAEPDNVFFFYPGGMGINFIKQYAQAGLDQRIPLFGPGFSADNSLVDAVGEAALGMVNSAHWSRDLDNAANRQFVDAYIAAYDREPTLYAAQGYDTARLIGSALAAVAGDVSDTEGLRAALRAADFDSVRGDFRFGRNQHPIQDIYVRRVVRGEDGNLTNALVAKVFDDHQDAYVGDCGIPEQG
ncbi:ABC transporter substrate-binding protein [Sediminicurvatus halobius]|uniref:ABC transporter substrate-binding protein n=1 Tax=Sediminicurvatus halobius TaxID=2182432 RepID=A0A2U2MW28_9GAMM|nr:ABC transporter substrate-binding protein [Spiribacter halobius]PWG61059.1 ABC transporter substrate-binding protein [Spiribacter halobius]UEX76769.1 ABC transporter substrate-binding protein [Spiribacter halobius]